MKDIYEIIEELGEETVLNEMIQILTSDQLDDICETICKNFDLDYEEEDDENETDSE